MCLLLYYVSQIQPYWREVVNASVSSRLGLIELKAHNDYLYYKDTIILTKATVQKSIERLPSEFSIDELIDQLIFIQKVEDGLQQSKGGNVVSHEDVKSIISKWSK